MSASTASHKISYVYGVIASPKNYFAEMAAVSMSTLRAAAPGARIVALTDGPTSEISFPALEIVRSLVDEWVVEDLPADWSGVQRSRHLALKMRHLIDGHIVQLDADTLIAHDPSDIANHSTDFAAVADIYDMPEGDLLRVHQENGWEISSPYMNGGVWSARDTQAMRDFFDEAYALWVEGGTKGIYSDQYAISRALKKTSLPMTWLPLKYNFYMSYLGKVYMKPSIYHVFSGDFDTRLDTLLHILAKSLKTTGQLDEDLLESFRRDKNPWTRPSHPKQFYALGRPVSAVAAKLRKILER